MLIENDLYRGRIDKIQMAIDRIKTFEPPEGYYLAYSGGKDSDTILALAKMSGVKFDAHYHLTTVDPPELVYHIRKHPEVIIEHPKMSMWKLIRHKGFLPTRQIRYCCEYLKENGGKGRMVMTGIRALESIKRSKRKMIETCYKDPSKHYVNPIIDWTTQDVWQFIKEQNIDYCKLYNEGWKRLGCIMCPMSRNTKQEAKRYPKIADAYKRAINRTTNNPLFKNSDEYYEWWLNGKSLEEWKEDKKEMKIFKSLKGGSK
jgi:phosphoadenosine phosphosulfate reductase